MTFLSKIGKILVTGLQILTGLEPFLAFANPKAAATATTVESDLNQLLQIITSAEAAGQALGLPGPDKLRMAAPLIMQVLLQSEALVGKPIANPALALQGATAIGSGLADFLNAIHPDAVTATTVAVSSPAVNTAAATGNPTA